MSTTTAGGNFTRKRSNSNQIDETYISYFPERKKRDKSWMGWICSHYVKPSKIFKHLKHIFKSCFTRRPYFAFVHTLLSFPLSFMYFITIYLGLLIATAFSPIFIGMFMFAVVAWLIRVFVLIEIFLARHLLCMNHKIVPRFKLTTNMREQLVRGVRSLTARSHLSIEEEEEEENPLIPTESNPYNNNNNNNNGLSSLTNPSPIKRRESRFAPGDQNATNHNTFSSYNISLATQDPPNNGSSSGRAIYNDPDYFMKTPPARSVDFLSPTSPMKQILQTTNLDESFHHYDSDDSDNSVDSIHSPTSHNSYYYQHYGTMLGRSIDIHSNNPLSRGASATGNPIRSTVMTMPLPSMMMENNNAANKGSAEEPMMRANSENGTTQTYSGGLWDNLKRLYNNSFEYAFCRDVGFSVLYFTMKIPIALLSFFTSMILFLIPVCAVAFPIIHIVCQASDATHTGFCARVMTSTHEGSWVYIGWSFWLIYSIPGNIILAIVAFFTLPFCIYGMRFMTRFNRESIVLVSKTLNEH